MKICSLIPYDTLKLLGVNSNRPKGRGNLFDYIDKKKNDKEAIQELIKQTDAKFKNVEVLLAKLSY